MRADQKLIVKCLLHSINVYFVYVLSR